jgi:hypothetical protein
MATEPDLCFITTCRGRLAHLQETLPMMVAQPGTETVVVDYDCPERAGDWVEANFPQARVVRSGARPWYEGPRARNLGAQAARAPWLCMLDADTVLAADFAEVVRPLLRPGQFLRPMPRHPNARGMGLCRRQDFDAIDGYDEVLQGYGSDDQDLFWRLAHAGLREGSFPGELIRMIEHDPELRTRFHEQKDHRFNSFANHVYCSAKWDLMRVRGKLSLKTREELYSRAMKTVLDAALQGGTVPLTIPLGRSDRRSGTVQSYLVYQVTVPAAGQPPDS